MAEDANARIRVDIDTAAALANIKNLQRQISAFHTSLAKSGAAASAASMQMQQSLLNSINKTGQFSATIKNVKTTTDSFTNSLEKNKLSMGEYFRYSGAATKTFGRFFRTEFDTINKVARERVKDLQTQYIKMGRDANGAMRAIAVRPLALDMENLSTKTQIAAQRQALLNQLLKQGSTNLLNFGKNTQWAGRQLMVGFTVPLVMLGSVAAKTFMDMEKQAVRFKRVYGEMFTTTEETNKALQDIKTLANEFTKYGVAVSKTMELAADIAATGKMGADLTAQVAEATRLAVLGGVEQTEALKATISITDAFGVSAKQLAQEIDFLNAVENQTITSIEDLTIAIPKAGPVVQQLGGDVQDLTFFLTAMREGGINASEGANALKSGLASLINPTGVASKMLSGFGINIKGIVDANKGDVKGIVIDFAKALDQLDPLNRAQAIEQLFGKFQFARLSTLFQNVIKEGNQASRVLKLANATTEELAILSERELKKVEDSPLFKFQKAVEDIKVTLVPLGEAFLKAVTPVLEFGTSILKKFNELDAGAKQFVVGLTAIAGVIGPVFLMGFGLIANGVANVIKMFTFFKTSMNKAGTASTQLGMQTEYMTQQQLEASAVAASLDQVHQKLRQTFTSEAGAVDALTAAYRRSIAAQAGMTGGVVGRTRTPKKYASGIMSVPGPRGAGDVVPAMLSPGEAVIPAKQSRKYSGIISSLIADNVPGFRIGRNPFASMLGRSRVAVRMKDQDFISGLRQGGKDAKYKSAFDTQTGADYIMPSGSKTTRQRDLRSAMERDVFGLDPKTTPTSSRPTYGYARTPILSSFINRLFGVKGKNFNSVTRNLDEDSLGKYGNIDLVTKGSVAKRSSAFAGDALVNYNWATHANTKRRSPNLNIPIKNTGIRPSPMRGASSEQLGSFGRFGSPFKKYDNNPPAYVETYTPGGFAFNEIDKIIAKDPAIAKALKQELKAAGLGSVRVTGSNFVARLFKKMGVPGYFQGTGSVSGNLSSDFEKFKAQKIGELRKSLRGRPSEKFAEAYSGMTYGSRNKEFSLFSKAYEEAAIKAGLPSEEIKKNIKNYEKDELSHLRKDTRLIRIGDQFVDAKNWKVANLLKEQAAVNQILQNITQKGAIDASGKNLGTGSFVKSLDPNEIARMTGLPVKTVQKELAGIINGDHPVTRNATKTFIAVSEKYGQYPSTSRSILPRVKGLQAILENRLVDRSPGNFFDAVKGGKLSLSNRPDLDQMASQSQKKAISRTSNAISKAQDRLVTPTSGVPKPSDVKRTGGGPKDTRMIATQPGEVVLSNKSVKAIKRGGTARVGRFNFGNVIPGREDGDPSNQRQRGPDGRFVSSKSQEATPGRTGMSGGMMGMVASGAVMAGSMMPGPIGKMSQDLMMPVMMASMILPMLGAFAPVVAALGGLAIAGFALKGAFDEAQDTTLRLSEALGSGQKAIEGYAEFAGTATAGQIMDRRRSDALSPFTTKTGKTTFGQSFMESEQGQALTGSTRESISKVGKAGTQNQLINQLVTAVSSGALNAGQARSIVANLATEINDASFGMSVNAKLIELLGPNGENLVKEPLQIRVKMAEESRKQVLAQMPNVAQASDRTALASNITGTAAIAGAGIGAAIGSPFGAVGAIPGAAIGGIIGTAIGGGLTAFNLADSLTKLGTSSAATVATGMMALQQHQELVDSLDLEYERRIQSAKAAGDVAEAERLTTEHIKARETLLAENAKTTAAVLESYTNAGFFGQGAMGQAVDKAIERKYEDDPIMQAMALGAKDQIVAASGLDQTQEYQMKLLVATGDLDPMVVSQLLANFANDGAQLTNVLNLMTNLGSAEGNKAVQIMNMFQDKDGNPLKEQQTKFIADVSAKTPAEAKKYLELFAEISKTSGILDAEVVLSFYNNNPKAAAQYQAMLDKINAVDGKMTMDFVQNLIGEGQFEQFKKNQAYFESLDPVQQKTYMSVFTNTMQLKGDPDMQKAYKLWLTEPGNAKKMFEEFAVAKSVSVTEATMDATKAVEDDVEEESTGGGSGPAASSLDDVLKKLRDIRKNQVGVTKGFEASAAAINKLFGGGRGISLFSGIENDMRSLGAEEDLITLIAGMDPEEFEKKKNTLFNFNKQTGEIIGFKDQLKNIGKALSAVALGQYVSDQQKSAKESRNQVLAFNQLRAAGYSVAEAYETIQDAAVASAVATGDVTRDQINVMLQELRNAQNAMKEAARLTPEGLQEVFEDGFNKAMETFDAKERKLTLEYEVKIANDEEIIRNAQSQIAAIQYQLDDYEADLRGIEDQEDAINKTYDEKLEALEKVRKANQKVLEQEKGRLSVAEAITRGDLAAAARAVQDVRASSAAGYFSSQTDALNAGRESALDSVRGERGLSRIQIQEQIKTLTNQIFEIEESSLEPASERVRLATEELEKRIREEEVLGKTKTEWQTIKSNIDLARVSSAGYKSAMEEALLVVLDVQRAWAGIESKTVTLTTIQQTVAEGSPSAANSSGNGNSGSNNLTPAQQAAAELQAKRDAPDAWKTQNSDVKNRARIMQSAVSSLYSAYGIGSLVAAYEQAHRAAVQTGGGSNPQVTSAAARTAYENLHNKLKQAGFASGGEVMSYMANGGSPLGSDTVPAMLTPGEFVVKRPMVNKYGTDLLNQINSGSFLPNSLSSKSNFQNMQSPRLRNFTPPSTANLQNIGSPRFSSPSPSVSISSNAVGPTETKTLSSSSVYNYNLSVNVASQSDPNAIAQTVMGQIRSIDSQRIRGSRF